MTNKQSFRFFLIMLMLFAVTMCVIGYSMAQGANSFPAFRLRAKAVAADSVSIYGGSLHAEHVDSVIVVTMRASDKVITDTIYGSSDIVGIIDDTLRLDIDSTGSYAIMTFGGFGAGLRWNRGTDKLQISTNLSTWSDILTTLAIGSEIHDSLNANWATFVAGGGTDSDSTFVAQYSSRWRPLGDSAAQYIGDTGDSTVLRFIGASTTSNADDTIMSFCKIYYGEAVVDSALVTYGTLEAAVAALGSGDITGVITTEPLTGGASTGDVNIGFDWTWLWGFNDTMTARVALASCSDSTIAHTGNAVIRASNGAIYIDAPSPANGAIFMQVGGAGQLLIDTGSVEFGRRLTMNSDTIQDFTGTGLTAAGKILALSIPFLYGYVDTTTAKIPTATLADTTAGGAARAESAKTATTADSALASARTRLLLAPQGSANTFGRMVGDSIDVDSIHAGRISIGTDASITDITGDGLAIAAGALTASLGTAITSVEITDDEIVWADLDSVDAKIAIRDVAGDTAAATLAGVRTIGGNWVNTANPWADNEVADNITVTGMGDLTDITAGNGLTGTSLTGPSPTINVVAGANGLTVNADSLFVDTTKIMRVEELRANWLIAWADSTLGLGSGAGLTITDAFWIGTDIDDDTLVVDYYPEYDGAVLADLIIPTWKDSIKIYGYIDTVAGMGNTMYFNDSVLTSGLHRRGVQLAIKHPLRVDSLRYIIVQGLVKDSSGTNSMYLKGMLRTSNFRAANVDSNAASTIKDYDSLGGDFTDVASVRQFVLSGGAITEGSPWYLLLIARHVSGTAWNWAQVGRVRAVYSRTRL